MSKRGKSKAQRKFQGVYNKNNKFHGHFQIDGAIYSTDIFDTSKEAAIAYDRAAILARRPLCKLNFPDQVPKDYKPRNDKAICTICLKEFRSQEFRRYRSEFENHQKLHSGNFQSCKFCDFKSDIRTVFNKSHKSQCKGRKPSTSSTSSLSIVQRPAKRRRTTTTTSRQKSSSSSSSSSSPSFSSSAEITLDLVEQQEQQEQQLKKEKQQIDQRLAEIKNEIAQLDRRIMISK